jgi:ABC-type antimicrobial peptide transport system permease subunit
MLPVLVGIGIGIFASFAFGRLISSMLYRIHPHDPATFVAMPLFLAAAASLAAYLPARRATKVDPVLALKEE